MSKTQQRKKTRLLVVDDHPFFRAGIIQWINQQDTLTCVGEAGSIKEAREAVKRLQPDIILLDLRLGDGDGLDLIAELAETHPESRILALSQFDEVVYARRALKAGARGYLMKSVATDDLQEAVQCLMSGTKPYLSRKMEAIILGSLLPSQGGTSPGQAALENLSHRELQVFQLIGAGRSSREIANYLKISQKTVDSHREHLKEKLGLPDAAALVRAATIWVETDRLPGA
jgi:DNA-binding NarL/FixJ family response regulator